MITRLYANNFRCLVSFEANFDSFGVLCGPNGAGKSSVFDVLKLIRDLAAGDTYLGGEGERDIARLEFTNWYGSAIQEFELGVKAGGHSFEYLLHLQQVSGELKPRILRERATCDKREVFPKRRKCPHRFSVGLAPSSPRFHSSYRKSARNNDSPTSCDQSSNFATKPTRYEKRKQS